MTALLVLMLAAAVAGEPGSIVNTAHLEHLTETVSFGGQQVDIVHVYANFPDYRWTSAAESGPEGIACVDDAARAAVFYLRRYELTRNEQSRARATALLKFVAGMETPEGTFYNFIFADRTVNSAGETSRASFGWWASRAVWAMSKGYSVLREADPTFAASLRAGVERALPHAAALLKNFGQSKTVKGLSTPRWLLYESGADVTSELLFGLTEYYSATRDTSVRRMIEQFSEGIIAMQEGDLMAFPYGAHRSWETMWHMWGNGQTQALAAAGNLLKNPAMLHSARREADGWYVRLLIGGFAKERDLSDSTSVLRYEQIAYGVRPVALGYIRLFEATGEKKYLALAGLAASWLTGNNVLHAVMYDSSTGRCFDGISDSTRVNRNSGAESTIEALTTVQEIERYPEALRFLRYRKTMIGPGGSYAVFRDHRGHEATLAIDAITGDPVLLEGAASARFLLEHK